MLAELLNGGYPGRVGSQASIAEQGQGRLRDWLEAQRFMQQTMFAADFHNSAVQAGVMLCCTVDQVLTHASS